MFWGSIFFFVTVWILQWSEKRFEVNPEDSRRGCYAFRSYIRRYFQQLVHNAWFWLQCDWKQLKQHIKWQNPFPKNIAVLENTIPEELYNITQDYIINLFRSILRRLKEGRLKNIETKNWNFSLFSFSRFHWKLEQNRDYFFSLKNNCLYSYFNQLNKFW